LAQEKYPELWNNSSTRDVKIITQKINNFGKDQQLQFEWGEVYHSPDPISISQYDIPGPNSVLVTVSPYTGNVIQYSEHRPSSVINGNPPVDLTPIISERQAANIAKNQFATIQNQNMRQTEPESLGLKILMDKNKVSHLTWNFKITDSKIVENKEHEISFREFYYVSVDAHDGSIIWKSF
jgi:Zn-dependent metalloprotease